MSHDLIIILVLTFVLAGTIGGIAGLVLPMVSLGMLSLVFDLETAMALLLAPSFATNLWPAFSNGDIWRLLYRFCPFLMPATGAVWPGAALSGQLRANWLETMLGSLLHNAIAGLTGFQPPLHRAYERPVGMFCDLVNCVLTGLTGSFVVPGVMFLQALRLDRHHFVQAVGILFTL